MTVRAKFKVESITSFVGHSSIRLTPVTSGSEENKAFYRWTPGGFIELQTINEEAAKQFELGAEMYIDFTKAD